MNNAEHTTVSTMDTYEPDRITEAIVSAVADAEGASPLELRPLATVIDPDALAALFRDGKSGVSVAFHYHGHRVRVCGDDRAVVEVRDD